MSDILPRMYHFNQIARTGYTRSSGSHNNSYNSVPAYPQSVRARLTSHRKSARLRSLLFAMDRSSTRRTDRDNADRDVRHIRTSWRATTFLSDVPLQPSSTPGGCRNNSRICTTTTFGRRLCLRAGRDSHRDRREFDKAYAKFVNNSRKNDDDDLQKDARH